MPCRSDRLVGGVQAKSQERVRPARLICILECLTKHEQAVLSCM